MHSAILRYHNAILQSFTTAHDIYVNNAYDLYLMTAPDIYAYNARGICANSLWQFTIFMQKALTTYSEGQAALWVANGCTPMSKPLTT